MVKSGAEVALLKATRQAHVLQTLAEARQQDRMRAAEGRGQAHELQITIEHVAEVVLLKATRQAHVILTLAEVPKARPRAHC